MKNINVILVDDHDILMDGIESILKEAPYIQVVGKAASVTLAEDLIQKKQPELVITDINMGEESGLELTKHVIHKFPHIKVLVLSMHEDVQHISSMLDAGALGYLLKNVKQSELFIAIENIMAGRQYIQQSIAKNYARARHSQLEARKQSLLTPRELEISRLIVNEFTTAEISKQLFLSEHTVETHRKNIWRKTGVKSVIGLLNYVREQGLF